MSELDRRMVDGDSAFLSDLGAELIQRTPPGSEQVWQYVSVLNRAIRLLALIAQLLWLDEVQDRPARTRVRCVASLIASKQDTDCILPLIRGGHAHTEASDARQRLSRRRHRRAEGLHRSRAGGEGIDLAELPEELNWASARESAGIL
ncbi:DUF6183 family protein [Streptomyces shenzhenensis]|uniref:DUF6183 family protein n=1 Tax=Streptomyces shenzhenensis TaxID=943815 RepID=UPI0036C04E0D